MSRKYSNIESVGRFMYIFTECRKDLCKKMVFSMKCRKNLSKIRQN